ncbi:MAG: DUF3426 domain-containing protein [Gammaproteobacteria bacterium]
MFGANLTMYTYCPNCSVVFEVSSAQLSCAAGKVRCGECRHVFMATKHLYNNLASARAAMDAYEEDTGEAAAESPDDYVRLPDVEQEMEQEIPLIAPHRQGGWDQHTFSFREVFSGLSILVLLGLLGAQYVWFNRDTLAAHDIWRPWVGRLCTVLDCALPLRTDISQLAILNRDVRQHPVAENALLINASFENRADFVQPYPVFEITFADTSGKAVAARRFLPSEYLADKALLARGLPAATPVQVVLEIMDPGDQAVSFQFGFL